MNRLVEIASDQYDADQKRMADTFQRVIGQPIRGPFALWLGVPHVGVGTTEMFEGFRKRGKVDRRLDELATLIVARHFSAEFAFVTHEKVGVKMGLAPETVEAIRKKEKPNLVKDDEKLVYEVATTLLATNRLPDALYQRAVDAMGREWLLELVTGMGFFAMISMTLNAFEMPPEGGRRPFA
jgi:4-carboxymuconolactone decarboxylase